MPAAAERAFVREKMNRFERRAMRSRWNHIATSKIGGKEDRSLIDADFSQYVNDPVGFFRDVLKIDLWSRQAEVANDLVTWQQVAVKTGHKIGKSLMAAGLALWWICTRANATVIVTAPALHQVKNIIWKELRELHKRVRDRIGGIMPKDPLTGLHLPGGNEIIGLTTDKPERIAGLSGKAVFLIIDEASGYADLLYQALETSTAGGDDTMEGAGEAKILAIGNPTRTAGWFFDIFRNANPDWSRRTISSEENPNAQPANDNGEEPKRIKGLMTHGFIQKLRRKYGPNPDTHPIYMVRVKGEYPEHSSSAVIAMRDVERAMSARRRQEVFVRKRGEVVFGVDVGRFGDDDSAIAARVDDWIAPLESFSGLDGWQVAERVQKAAHEWLAKGYDRVRVNVDGIGAGASVVDALIRSDLCAKGKLYVVDVQASAKPTSGEDRYLNLRAQLWFEAGEWLKAGSLPDDPELSRDLLAAEYKFAPKGQLQVLGKEEMKKRIDRSPDRGDAVCLAVFASSGSVIEFNRAKPSDNERSRLGGYNWRGRGGAL